MITRAIQVSAILIAGLAGSAFAANGIDCSQITKAQAQAALGIGLPSSAFPLPKNIGGINQLIRQSSAVEKIEQQTGLEINNVNQAVRAAQVVAPGGPLAGLSTGEAMQLLLGACGVGSDR